MNTFTSRKKCKYIISSIPSDSHMWNLVYLQLLVEELGHEVINLGCCVPIDFLISQCHRHRPDVLIISTVNGHGHLESIDIIKEIKKFDLLKNMKVLIGGKLGILGKGNESYVKKLITRGYDGVFIGDSAVNDFLEYITGNSHIKNSEHSFSN